MRLALELGEQRLALGVRVLQGLASADLIGDIDGDREHAVDLAPRVAHRLEVEREVAILVIQRHPELVGHVRLAGLIDPIEDRRQHRLGQLGERLAVGLAGQIVAADHPLVDRVGELEPMLGPGQDRDGDRRLEQEVIALALDDRARPPIGDDPLGGLGADHQGAADLAVVVEHGRVPVGPVDLFDPSVAEDRNQRVLVPGGPRVRHHVVDLRPDDRPALLPAVATALPERPGVFADPEARPVGIIIELDQLGSPPQEHRLT